MQKIMFNDRYELTNLVLSGQKTQTRILVKAKDEFLDGEFNWDSAGTMITFCRNEKEFIDIKSPYFFGEELSVTIHKNNHTPNDIDNIITITDIRFEKLQDISDEDCLAEGIEKMIVGCEYYCYSFLSPNPNKIWEDFKSPRQAFAALIDKINGKGTWASNPYVWVYDFELVK
jgi:hypothetical protein